MNTSNGSSLSCKCVGELINRIVDLRRGSSTQDSELSVVNNCEVQWAQLFMEFILGTAYCQGQTCQGKYLDVIQLFCNSVLHCSPFGRYDLVCTLIEDECFFLLRPPGE
ncbi:hypothetical protein NECAME_08735 [Necator americanus]|uniref:Uncharacterized protein n=1 Tax=Necator americanus TaxID=51031 RepID=W2TGV1_NECAM|nr:hypothetical protein NECAME_08735 [Necator americanus]ETN81073.1 hypothetical protein NECAME_08735 [Necator americanus]